jgi:hypothetical protein
MDCQIVKVSLTHFQSDGATGKELHVNTSTKEDSVAIVNMALESKEMVIREGPGVS